MNTICFDLNDMIEYDTTWEFGTNFITGREPAKPHNTLTFFDTPGTGRFLGLSRDEDDPGANAYDYATIQIRIRNHNYNDAITQATEIVNRLHGVGNLVLNGTLYTLIKSLDSPSLLDWDDNNRARVIVNFEVQRTPYKP